MGLKICCVLMTKYSWPILCSRKLVALMDFSLAFYSSLMSSMFRYIYIYIFFFLEVEPGFCYGTSRCLSDQISISQNF